MDQKSKFLLTFAIIFFGLGLLLVFQSQKLGEFRLIACDVGQGDAQLLVSPGGKQILVDGGPGTRILECLGKNLPFWDRTIEMVVLTHPQKDHLEGLVEVLNRYKVEMIATTQVKADSSLFEAWQKAIEQERAKVYRPKAGDKLVVDSLELEVLWPSADKLALWGLAPPSDLNESSVVIKAKNGSFCAYLTGDIPKETLETIMTGNCQVLKVAHHGSKTGTNENILDQIKPQIAIIQVGKNSYGHPHKEVIEALESKAVKILRNDINGDIDVSVIGDHLEVKSEK